MEVPVVRRDPAAGAFNSELDSYGDYQFYLSEFCAGVF